MSDSDYCISFFMEKGTELLAQLKFHFPAEKRHDTVVKGLYVPYIETSLDIRYYEHCVFYKPQIKDRYKEVLDKEKMKNYLNKDPMFSVAYDRLGIISKPQI